MWNFDANLKKRFILKRIEVKVTSCCYSNIKSNNCALKLSVDIQKTKYYAKNWISSAYSWVSLEPFSVILSGGQPKMYWWLHCTGASKFHEITHICWQKQGQHIQWKFFSVWWQCIDLQLTPSEICDVTWNQRIVRRASSGKCAYTYTLSTVGEPPLTILIQIIAYFDIFVYWWIKIYSYMIVCQQKLNIQHFDSLNFLFPCVSSPLPALHPPIHILYKLNYFKHFIIFSYILLTTFSFDILTEKKTSNCCLIFR